MPLTPVEALNKVVDDRLANLRLTSARTLMNLAERNRLATKQDTNINWDVEVGGGAIAIEAMTADGADTATDNVVPANIRIGNYRVKHQFRISRVAIAEAAQRAPQELSNLFSSHVDRGITHIAREINRLIYLGDGSAASGEVIGINQVANDTYSYGGISPTTYPAWRALNFGNPTTPGTARSLTKSMFLDLEQRINEQEAAYDMIVTSPAIATSYNKLFDAMPNSGVEAILSNNGSFKNVDLGHGGRYYQGVPIVEDPMCPAGTIYFLNSSDITLHTFRLPQAPAMSQQEQIVTTGAWGMNLHISELPSNNSAVRKFELFVIPQLQVFTRKALIVLKDLS